jgi:hypothetical protein
MALLQVLDSFGKYKFPETPTSLKNLPNNGNDCSFWLILIEAQKINTCG